MNKPLPILFIVLALLVAFALYRASTENYPVVWINAFDECESSSEFGELIAADVPAYFDAERTRPTFRIPHGTRVELMGDSGDAYEIRYRNARLFVPSTLISDYDPAGGVRPDPSACAS